MTSMKKQKLELTWIGKDERLRRFLIRHSGMFLAGIQKGFETGGQGILDPGLRRGDGGNAGGWLLLHSDREW